MTEPEVPVQVTPIEPVRTEMRNGCLFADFGKAAYGNLLIKFPAHAPETNVAVRLGEKLGLDGHIDRDPPGSVNYCEAEIAKGGKLSIGSLDIPTKPFHLGDASVKMPASIGEVTPFRYVEIPNAPDNLVLHQLAVQAPFDEEASDFECSEETLNAVWGLCKHTVKATTAFGIYIDGERERIAYEGDAYINLLSHYACDPDPRVARRTFEHLLKFPTWPTEWSLQMPMIAEADYEATGNPVLASRHFDALMEKLLPGKARGDGLLEVSAIVDWPPCERDGYNDGTVDPNESKQAGPMVNTVANAFHHRALCSMARLAEALGKATQANQLSLKADRVREAFQAAFFDRSRSIYTDGEGSNHASLHANMFPLAFGLVPADYLNPVADFVQAKGMACSVYGAQFLLEALYRADRSAAALELMRSRSGRSWWHMIELGSTMTLEAWDSGVKPNLTWNHAWGAAPANIISRFVLGVRPLEPGYRSVLIAPRPHDLEWLRGKVPTPFGPVELSLQNGADMHVEIGIPGGISASLILPGGLGREELPPGQHTIHRNNCRKVASQR